MSYSRVWNGLFYMSECTGYLVRSKYVCFVRTIYPV